MTTDVSHKGFGKYATIPGTEEDNMAIINNRQKIASEVPSQKYKDNWDAIFGKKRPTLALEQRKEMEQLLEDDNNVGEDREANQES